MKNKRMKLLFRGPAYEDGSGEHFTVEYDSEWGQDKAPAVHIKQYSDDWIVIDPKHLGNLIEDLQEIHKAYNE